MTAQQKRSAERRGHNELSLSKEALKAFQHFKARAGLADDSQAILALLQQAEPENLFDDTTPQDFFRGSEQPGFKEPLTERALVRRATQVLRSRHPAFRGRRKRRSPHGASLPDPFSGR